MSTNIIINTQVEGIHSWPECNIEEVSFLKYPHRHIFYITAKKEVTHLDRDIEIIQLKRAINEYLLKRYDFTGDFNVLNFKNDSCEMIAKDLMEEFNLNYCSVLEDNENGAEIYL